MAFENDLDLLEDTISSAALVRPTYNRRNLLGDAARSQQRLTGVVLASKLSSG